MPGAAIALHCGLSDTFKHTRLLSDTPTASDSRLSSAAVCTRGACSKLRSVVVARWLHIIARKWWCAWQELEVHDAAVDRLRDIVGGTSRLFINNDY